MNKKVNQKSVILMLGTFIVLGSIFSFFIYREYYNIKKIDINKFVKNDSITVTIDEFRNRPEDKIIFIRGWAIKKNQDLQKVETYVALKNIKTSEVFKISTIKQERKDVTSYFNEHFNDPHKYNHSGFIARVDRNAVKNKGEYEICILYLSDNNNIFMPTGKIININ